MEEKAAPLWGSCRMTLALVCFLGIINVYGQRINLSVAVVCMVNQTAVAEEEGGGATIKREANDSSTTAAAAAAALFSDKCASVNHGGNLSAQKSESGLTGELAWSRKKQGVVLGSFFYGYLATQILGGWLAGRFGGKWVFGVGSLAVAVAALLIPVAARTNYVLVIVLRVIQGLGQGVAFPACHVMWSQWAPPEERGKLVGFSYAGAQVGNIITLPLAALLCDYGFDNGWGSIFYVYGIVGILWFFLWAFLTADTPSTHPRISKEELAYLTRALDGVSASSSDRKSMSTPWLAILTSAPVWGLVVINAASDWGAYTLLTNIPTYMRDVLKFDIKSNGFFSAIPYIAFWICINIFGVICDGLIKSGKCGVKNARRVMTGIGMIPPAILLVITGYVDCTNAVWAIVLLTLAQAFNGAQFGGGCYCNHIDIAPDFAGILMGISNTVGAITGVLAPLLIGVVVKQGTEEEWRCIFFICGGIIIGGTLFYLFVAEGDVQEWAKPKQDKGPQNNPGELLAMLETDKGETLNNNTSV